MASDRYLSPAALEHRRRLELLRLLRRVGAEVLQRWPRLRDISWQREMRVRRERLADLRDENTGE